MPSRSPEKKSDSPSLTKYPSETELVNLGPDNPTLDQAAGAMPAESQPPQPELASFNLDLESGSRSSTASSTIWHHPNCKCTCEKDYLQLPLPTAQQDDYLPRYKSLASPELPLIEDNTSSELPPEKYNHVVRRFRWAIMSVYRRLCFLVILPNLLAIIILAAKQSLITLSPASLALAVAINVTAAVLMRQELVINLLFIIFGKCPQWMPLRIRRLAAKIYHLGGVHSGGGIAATVWYFILTATVIRDFAYGIPPRTGIHVAVLVVTISINFLFVSIVVLAHPQLRAKWHNAFEAVHRFAGWSAVGAFWAQFFLLAELQRQNLHPHPSLSTVVFKSPVLYLLMVITASLILPWLRLRKVPVRVEPLSNHATRLHFDYTNLPLCAAPRLSHRPLKEWHSFAGIPEDNGKGFSVLISKAGDWTADIIRNPPSSIWVRGIPVRGVLHIAPIFKSMVLVATGSGIGPVLSLLAARTLNCRILWSTPDPLKTYRHGIMEDVLSADPDAVIINTSVYGRPDLVQETYSLFKDSGAEAIFVISNPRVTRKVVYGLESRGVPIFAPIFDS